MQRNKWNTYRTVGFTVQHGDDPAASGGVTFIEVRKSGKTWCKRYGDSNGCARSAGPVIAISEAEGEAAWLEACSKEE